MRAALTMSAAAVLLAFPAYSQIVPQQYIQFTDGEKLCRTTSLSSTDVWLMALQFQKGKAAVVFRSGKVTGLPATTVNDPTKVLDLTKAFEERALTFTSEGWMHFATPSGNTTFTLAPQDGNLAGVMKLIRSGETFSLTFTCGAG